MNQKTNIPQKKKNIRKSASKKPLHITYKHYQETENQKIKSTELRLREHEDLKQTISSATFVLNVVSLHQLLPKTRSLFLV